MPPHRLLSPRRPSPPSTARPPTARPPTPLVAVSLRRAPADPTQRPCPLMLARVEAGFPSPADDFVEGPLDLNELLIRRPETTFFLRVRGGSMEGAGIHSGDLLIVDRGLEPRSGDVVIAALGGGLTVKRIEKKGGGLYLMPDGPGYEPIEVTSSEELFIWGVVRHVIHEVS